LIPRPHGVYYISRVRRGVEPEGNRRKIMVITGTIKSENLGYGVLVLMDDGSVVEINSINRSEGRFDYVNNKNETVEADFSEIIMIVSLNSAKYIRNMKMNLRDSMGHACKLAREDNADMIVGRISKSWTIAHIEDKGRQAEMMPSPRFLCYSDGRTPKMQEVCA
jgi:hypothetical protein